MNSSDLTLALYVVGAVLSVCGSTLVAAPFPNLWRLVGFIMAAIGMVLVIIGAIISLGAQFIFVLIVFLAVVALMYRHGLLPKI